MDISVFIIILSLGSIAVILLAWHQHNKRMKKFKQLEQGWQDVINTANSIIEKLKK